MMKCIDKDKIDVGAGPRACPDFTKGNHRGLPLQKELPEGWEIKPIGEVCQFEKGKKPKNTGNRSDARTIPYINIKAFETGMPEEYAEPGNYPTCSKDDVLIVWDGARSGLVGKGVSGYIGSTLSKVWSELTNDKYLFYFLKSQYGYVNTNTKGVGIPHVDPNILYAIQLPIAPSPVQKLIVSEIEKQFSRLDEAVAALKRVRASLKRYKASVLKAAVEGKLTEEWRKQNPNIEPADKLLKRILAERKKKWEESNPNKKYKEPSAPDTSTLPELPKGWVWVELKDISEFKNGINFTKHQKGEKGILTVDVLNMYSTSIFIYMDKLYRVDKSVAEDYLLKYGDVLFVRSSVKREGVGWASAFKEFSEPVTFCGFIIRARFQDKGIVPEYVTYFLRTNFARKFIIDTGSQVTITNVNQSSLGMIPIPLTSPAEQQKIVEEIESRLSVTEEIEETININLKRAERLRQAILKKAFSGRLVH